ncbi:MAG: PAS domain S-box protein [Sphingobacteriaceae bacterium]
MKINTNSFSLFKIPAIYLAISLIWIFLGNDLLNSITENFSREEQRYYQTCKGIAYVSVITIMLFILLKNQRIKLAKSEEQYKNLFANNPNPMWIYEIESRRFIAVNDAAVKKYGYSRLDFLKMTIYDIRPAEDREQVSLSIDAFNYNHKYSGRWVHKKKSGEEFTVSIISHKVDFNNLNCTMVLAIDINEMVENEKKLQEAYLIEKELNQALEHNNKILEEAYKKNRLSDDVLSKISNMVIILDKDKMITWVNKAFTEFTGYEPDEVVGKTSTILFGPNTDLAVIEELDKTLKKESFFTGEIINYTKDKREYWVQLNVSPLIDENGNLEGMISVENVITERKQKEAKIEAQNKVLHEIAWLSSHRFRRPVASIISLTEMLETTNEEERTEYMSLLKKSSAELDEATHEISEKINEVEKNHL